jgi:hypothetical protein
MKLLVLYQPKSEHARLMEEYLEDFRRLYPQIDIEVLDAESVEGVNICQVYDILEYPALLVVNRDQALQNMWLGKMLPQKQEVVSYLLS